MLDGLDLVTFLMPFKNYHIALASLMCTGRVSFLFNWDRLAQEGSQGGRKESPLAFEEPKRIAFFGRCSGGERFFPSWWTLVDGTQKYRGPAQLLVSNGELSWLQFEHAIGVCCLPSLWALYLRFPKRLPRCIVGKPHSHI